MLSITGKRVSVAAGIITAIGLIGFFLIMRVLNLHRFYELRYLNILILSAGDFIGLYCIKKKIRIIKYMDGLAYSFAIILIATTVFTAFMAFYLYRIDPGFMQFIKQNTSNGSYLDIWTLSGIIFSEGTSSGVVIALILMQYFKEK